MNRDIWFPDTTAVLKNSKIAFTSFKENLKKIFRCSQQFILET
jgi:hypothetical protein